MSKHLAIVAIVGKRKAFNRKEPGSERSTHVP